MSGPGPGGSERAGGPRVIDVRAHTDPDLSPVVRHLRADGVIAYPTETVYGLGSPCTEGGARGVRALKRRGDDKPMIALVASADAVPRLRWTEAARELAEIFWPGPLTLVLEDPERTFPDGVRHPTRGTVAIRVSSHEVVAHLVEAAGPLTSTSLNPPGEPPAVDGDAALDLVRRLGGDDVWVLDAGTLPPSRPSTLVDCTAATPVVVRVGAVPTGRLRCVLPEIHERTS